MDLLQYRAKIARAQSSRFTPREKRLDAFTKILHGEQYDHLKFSFSEERDGDPINGKRVLLDDRRPSSKQALPKELVREQSGLLFGEEHRPLVLASDDPGTSAWIAAFIHDTGFWLTLMDALWKGSPGSSFVVLRVLGDTEDVADGVDDDGNAKTKTIPKGKGRYYFEVWPGLECRPVFKRYAPDVVEKVDRRYFIGEDPLAAQGYDVDALKKQWEKSETARRFYKGMLGNRGSIYVNEWVCRIVLDENAETWYNPVPRYIYERPDWKDSMWTVDPSRTFEHGIGESPGYWIRPLPLDSDKYFPDGACLFEDVIDFEFRINRTTSQVGRALDYAGDPQMARARGPSGAPTSSSFGQPLAVGGTASDMIEVDAGGDAKFVEITGSGLQIAMEAYVSAMRDYAKAAGAMSRVTPDSKTGATSDLSAAAMKMLNFAQLVLAGILRETAAERPGDYLIRLAMRLWLKLDIELPSLTSLPKPQPKPPVKLPSGEDAGAPEPDNTPVDPTKPNPDVRLEWQWPDYYEPHGQEKLFEVQATVQAQQAGDLSQETAVANIGPMFDVTNTNDEIDRIHTDAATQLVSQVAQATEMAKVQQQFPPPSTGANKGVTPRGKS